MKPITPPERIHTLLYEYHIDTFFDNFPYFLPYFSALSMQRKDFLHNSSDYQGFLFFYVKGQFKVYSELANGERKLLRMCNSPMLLGEMELIRNPDDASLSVEAVEPGLILLLDYRSIRKELLSNVRFLNRMCESFAEKFAFFGATQTRNALQPAEEKLAEYLLSHQDSAHYLHPNLRTVAEELEISYRHLHRTLQKFVEAGYIEKSSRRIFLLDISGLEAIAFREM